MSDAPLFPAEEAGTVQTSPPAETPNAAQDQVLYRKWRPRTFGEVSGQDAITRTLRNSVASDHLAHAYLFCGPRGTGKTTLGRLLAKAANCEGPVDGEPCDACASCQAFNEGRAIDFIEQDAASHNGVDDIRQLRENVVLTPMSGRRKVYLLDEVHMLSAPAENALLKTLEEPPAHIIFVLATTDPQKVAGTIISRCQRFDLKRIPLAGVTERLTTICSKEGITLDRDSLEEIARSATGSLRDAINALEQVVAYYGPAPTAEQVKEALGLGIDARAGQFSGSVLSGDLGGSLALLSEVRDDGVDMKNFAAQVIQYLRGLLMVQAGVEQALALPKDVAEEVKAISGNYSRENVIKVLRAFAAIDWTKETLGAASSLPLELALVDLHGGLELAASSNGSTARIEPRVSPSPPVPPAPEAVKPAGVTDLPSQQSSPTPQTPATATPGNLRTNGDDTLDLVRETLKQPEKQLAALLNGSCEIVSTSDDKVVLGFYHTFHLERMEEGKFGPALEKAFQSVLGRPVSVAYEHTPQGPREEKPKGAGGHLVQAAREKHGARAVPQDG